MPDEILSRETIMCPDCNGTGEYVGIFTREPCRTCGGAHTIEMTVSRRTVDPCPRRWSNLLEERKRANAGLSKRCAVPRLEQGRGGKMRAAVNFVASKIEGTRTASVLLQPLESAESFLIPREAYRVLWAYSLCERGTEYIGNVRTSLTPPGLAVRDELLRRRDK